MVSAPCFSSLVLFGVLGALADSDLDAVAAAGQSLLLDDDCASAGEGCALHALQVRAAVRQRGRAESSRRDGAHVASDASEGRWYTGGSGEWDPYLNDWSNSGQYNGYNGYNGYHNYNNYNTYNDDYFDTPLYNPWPTPSPSYYYPAPTPSYPTPSPYPSYPAPSPQPSNGAWGSSSPAPSGLCIFFPKLCPKHHAPLKETTTTPAPATPPPVSLYDPSQAPLKTFYMYRVQGDENYPQPNHNLASLAGALWYLHNEIVWHKSGRYGTYFSQPVTRILKFKVQTRATEPVFELGMNFGVLNTFDSGKCTGPWGCDNFAKYGYAVGCETWEEGSPSNFPHQQWNKVNHYRGAIWYSLPGECPLNSHKTKTAQCKKEQPGGECPHGVTPTGKRDCTYGIQEVGQITVNELEGILDYKAFVKNGGREFDPKTDKGVHTSFWNGLQDEEACAERVEKAERLFRQKYPHQEILPDPVCDFDRHKFYPNRKT